jgi:phosphatidylcholine synthase
MSSPGFEGNVARPREQVDIEARPGSLVKGHDHVLRFLAWGVHIYTALGLVLAALIAVLLVEGGVDAFRWTFVLMMIATIIDATDGTLARRVRVKKVLPQFDGRKLDDLIDFQTYTTLPLLLIWQAELLPEGMHAWLLLPLLASVYGFSQVSAKTDDGYFLGFPSLWNIVAFYLYVLHLPGWVALGIIVALSLLTFVPSRYLYPSQPGRLNMVSNILGAFWACLLILILGRMFLSSDPQHDQPTRWLAIVSLFYPAFYMTASWVITLQRWFKGR